MRDLSNRVAPYVLFDAELVLVEREPDSLIEKLIARTTGKTYYERNTSFVRTLHSLSYRGDYNIGILFDASHANALQLWEQLTDESGHPVFLVIPGKSNEVDFLDYPIRHYFAKPSNASQSRVGAPFEDVWSVLL